VIFDMASSRTVITEDESLHVLEVGRHRLRLDGHCQVLELKLHIHDAFVANGTFVGSLHVL
jgi:hypothetical protein